jgi:hypothetical protein
VKIGFVPNMRVPGVFYVNKHLETLMFDELQQHVGRGDCGGFLPAVGLRGWALFTGLALSRYFAVFLRSENLMTAGMVRATNRVTPGSDSHSMAYGGRHDVMTAGSM